MNYVLSSDYSEVIAVGILETKYCVIAVGILILLLNYYGRYTENNISASSLFLRKIMRKSILVGNW